MAGSSGPDLVQNGLVLALDAADKNSYKGSGTTWKDLTSNAYTSTLTNGPTFSNTNCGVIVFDGTNDYSITTFGSASNLINDPTTNGGIISFSVWVNVVSNTSGGYIISSGGETSSTGFWMATQNGSPEVGIKTTSKVWYKSISSADFPLNTWVNWCAVLDNTNMSLYKNGVFYSITTSASTSVSSQFSRFTVSTPAAVLGSFCGNNKIGSVQIYNRVLTSTEILQNYNAVKSRFGL
jgi:hypothetical protein